MSVRGQQISHFNFSFNFKHCKQQKVFLVKNEFIFIWKKKKSKGCVHIFCLLAAQDIKQLTE